MFLPVPCPNCRKLIRSDVLTCPGCGLLRPGERWLRGLTDPEAVIRSILYANVALYALSVLLFPFRARLSANPFAFLSPSDMSLLLLGASGSLPVVKLHRWWTLLTANYLHGSLLHIFFNMVALRQIAFLVIREYGVCRMLSLYTLSGVAGFAVSCLAGVPFTLGASAAVCGLIGAALHYGRDRGGVYGRAVFQNVWGWALGIFVFGFLVPGINNWAHGGGMAAGYLLGVGLGYTEKARERPLHRGLAVGCVLATLAALLWGVGTALFTRISA